MNSKDIIERERPYIEEIANKYNLEKEYPITRHYKLMKIFESIR